MRSAGSLATLRRFAAEAPAAVDRCDRCASPVPSPHAHRYDPARRQLECVCDRCAPSAAPWKLVARRVELVDDLGTEADAWMGANVPVRLAYFVPSAGGEVTASFPSPAGPTQSVIDPAHWASLGDRVPRVRRLAPDVEALLVNRVNGARDTFVVSIDVCYHLVGLLRARRPGDLLGGAVQDFLADLGREAREAARA